MLSKFCKYNNWANSLLLDALVSNSSSLPESCILLFSHIVNAQMIWACRINGTTPSVGVWKVNDLEACKAMLEESSKALSQMNYLETTESPIIKYTTTTGDY